MSNEKPSTFWVIFKANIIKWSLLLVIFLVVFVAMSFTLATKARQHIVEDKNERLVAIQKVYGQNLDLMCAATNCVALRITTPDGRIETYIADKHFSLRRASGQEDIKFIRNLVSHDLIDHQIENMTFYRNVNILRKANEETFYIMVISLLILIVALITSTTYIEKFVRRNEKVKEINVLELEIQRELTESLHHEVTGPLTVIETNANAIKEEIKKNNRHLKGFKDRFKYIESGIENIKDLLYIMSNNKHIKYTNGGISIVKIVNNVKSLRTLLSFKTLRIDILNKNELSKYSVGSRLTNGELTNVFNTLINNSEEAGANKITIKLEKLTNDYAAIYVSDNGKGVRDKKGKISMTDDIFKYSYTTKEPSNMEETNILIRLFIILFGRTKKSLSTRGVGLAINRRILEMAGGSLTLEETSEKGTTFKITIPIKLTKENKIEKKIIKIPERK